jgi:hypothetical protein
LLSLGALCALGISAGVVWTAFTTSASAGSLSLSSLSLSPYARRLA